MSSTTSDAVLERMMALHPKIIDLTLDRVWRLLNALGNPERSLPPVIHVAGTNGKGSTIAMMRAGLEAAGHIVHVYTSPHLARFHERIRVSGSLISETELTALLDACYLANDGAPITYFEITTVAALLAFSRSKADFCLLEVGLGGRLDATNVVETPRATVITPVSIDHQQYLGDTLELIASEKAGIIKRGALCIVGPQQEAGLEVIETRAHALGAPVLAYGQHWHATAERDRMVFQDETGLLDLPCPNLPGAHQILNAGAALAVLRQLGLDAHACEAAVTQADWPARMQRLSDGPLTGAAPHAEIWLDGGHNPAAGAALAQTITALPERPTHAICGMLNTKDVRGYMRPLRGVILTLQAVSIPGETATLSAEETRNAAQDAGLDAHTAPDVVSAIDTITRQTPHARIVICGSLYLAGHILRENG